MNDHGDGVGTIEEGVVAGVQVHVPFALPGEQLLAEVWERDLITSGKWKATEKEPKWPVLGSSVAVVMPSVHRVAPKCDKFFGVCGGCRQQHFAYAQQLHHKQKRIEELFSGRSHSPDMQVCDILGARTDALDDGDDREDHGVYHYRNKMEFTCSTGRWLLDSDKVVESACDGEEESPTKQHFPFTIGMFPVPSTSVRRSRQIGGKRRRGKSSPASWSPRILSIDDCSLQSGAANQALKSLSKRLEASGLQAYNFQANKGFLKQLVIRTGISAEQHTEIMIGFVTTTLEGDESDLLQGIVDSFVQEVEAARGSGDYERIVSVVQRLDDQSLRESGATARERTLFGQPFFHDTILGHTFEISFDSFFQPNTAQASRLYREIQERVAVSCESGDASAQKPIIWDLFCGVGSIGICMGTFAAKVYGFEIVEAAVERARVNARLNGYSESEMQFFTMDLTKRWDENEWSDKVDHPDIVIVDPPRAGLHRKLIKMLRRLAPSQICYVSCNPESQVRDLEMLCEARNGIDDDDASVSPTSELASYEVEFLQPVDMLPHTPHIETIAWLRKRP